jgi:tetratricopeptide (TPR) repeat protein
MNYQYEPLADEYVFQDFLKDLFNNIYKTNTFEVYRSKGYSQFGVDVYSPQLKIAIQAKKKNILRNEPELIQELRKNLSETLQNLKSFSHPVEQLYFATTTKKYAVIQDEALQSSNSVLSVQFWSWEDIQKHISDYSMLCKTYYPHLTTQPLPKELLLTPHIDSNGIVGRDAVLVKIKDLFQSYKIVSIHGIGGLGKSSIAKVYYQNSLADFHFEKAEIQFRKAIEVNGKTFNLKTIQCYNGLFVLYWEQKKLKEALECNTEALKLLQNPMAKGNNHLFAMIANNLATLHFTFGQTSKAAEFIIMALTLHRESTNSDKSDAVLAKYYASAADIFSCLENQEVAIQFALHAIEYRSNLKLERDFELLFFYEKAADIYEKSGDHKKAAQLRIIARDAKKSFIADAQEGKNLNIKR